MRWIVRLGGGAPATMTRVRSAARDRPVPGRARPPAPTATTAGAAHMTVTPYRSTRRRISAPSTLRSTTCGTPRPVIANGIPQPLAWNIGSVCR